MLDHDLEEVWMDWRRKEGEILERRRREMFSQNLEREREVGNEGKWPLWPYIVACDVLPLCPSPQSCSPDSDT
jgi:hypothetical protein